MASSVVTAGTGYTMEVQIPWANLGVSAPSAGALSGLDVAVDVANAAGNARDHEIVAYNGAFNPYDTTPAQWGAIDYQACNSFTATNTPNYSPTPTFTNSPVVVATNTPTPVSRGANVPYTEYEAEAASYTGTLLGPSTAVGQIAAEASGREAVQLNSLGQNVKFTSGPGFNAIVVRYSVPDSGGGGGANYTLGLYVNGTFIQELPMTSTYTWVYGGWGYPYNQAPSAGTPIHVFDEVHLLLPSSYAAGSTVTLQRTAADTASFYVIDFIDLEQVGAAITQPANSLNAVTGYGATGNGSTDDTTALQNCINAAQAAGKIAYIPSGNYKISNFLSVPACSVQGAGMWYTTIHQINDLSVIRFNLNNASAFVSDLLLQGEVTNRNDSATDSAFDYHGGTGSTVQNVWTEHTKCGWWVGNSGSVTSNLMIKGCRFRDMFADGVNFCNGTSNSTITNCNFRSTGDDSVASWSPSGGGVNNGNMFNFNTVQCAWRADGFALYGGSNNNIEDNICTDTLDQSGIMVQQGFTSNGFSGTMNILRNTLTRCGGFFGQNYGAIDFWANQGSIGGAYTIDTLDINNATYEGMEFDGPNCVNGVTFTNVTINSPGTYGVQVLGGTCGAGMFSTTTVTAPGTAGLLNSGSFTINRGGGDVGW